MSYADGCVFFFFRAVIRQRCSIDDERLVGEIRESSVTNSFAKHASPSGRFARKFNMRSIHQTASPPSRVPAWNISGRDVITRFFFLSRVVGKNGWRGVVWGGIGYLCYIRALKRRAEKFVARIFYWKFRLLLETTRSRFIENERETLEWLGWEIRYRQHLTDPLRDHRNSAQSPSLHPQRATPINLRSHEPVVSCKSR